MRLRDAFSAAMVLLALAFTVLAIASERWAGLIKFVVLLVALALLFQFLE